MHACARTHDYVGEEKGPEKIGGGRQQSNKLTKKNDTDLWKCHQECGYFVITQKVDKKEKFKKRKSSQI